MNTVTFFDTKPYDREYFDRAPGAGQLRRQFHEARLTSETVARVDGANAVCVFVHDRLGEPCLKRLQEAGVQLVALRCAGFDNVDLGAAKSLGLGVIRVPAYSPHAVAEHAVALLLALNRKIHSAYNRIRENNFSLSGLVGFDLHGKTVGVVGTGKIGKVAAQIFRGFGTEVLAFDPVPDHEWAGPQGVRYVDFESLLAHSNIVSLHLPLTPQSRHVFNPEAFSRMKPGAFFINTSRGELVDTAALIAKLETGTLGGVALDVYEEEEERFVQHSDPIPGDDALTRLLKFPNVLVTAHQAYLTHEALTEIARVTTENLIRFGRGEPFLPGTVLANLPVPAHVATKESERLPGKDDIGR